MVNWIIKDKEFHKSAFLITFPLILQRFLSSILTLVDTYIFGTLGENALAVMSLTNIPLRVVQMFLFGAQSGTSIMISQFYGKKDETSVSKVLGVALWTVSCITLSVFVILLCIPESFLSLFSNNTQIVTLAVDYARFSALAFFFNAIDLIYLSALNAMEKTKTGTYILTSSMIVKVICDRLYTSDLFSLGIFGAGLATLTARLFEFLCCMIHMHRNESFHIDLKTVLFPGKEMLYRYFSSAGTVVINETIWGAGISAITNVFSHMDGSVGILSAYSVSEIAQNIINSISGGFSNATAIIVGVSVGNSEEEKQIRKKGCTMIFSGTLCGAFFGLILFLTNYFFGYSVLFPAFSLSTESANACFAMLNINALLLALRTFNNTIVVGVLRGAGDVKYAALIDILPLWLAAVPYAYLCGLILKLNISWVYSAYIVQYLVQSVFGILRLKNGCWIRNLT